MGLLPMIFRNPFKKENIKAFKELKSVVKKERFDLIHCHTPVGGVLGRLAARGYRKFGTKVIYTVHGFHFCKTAPKKNWLIFYPVEWLCSHWTDVLITINEEDYAFAQKHMRAKRVEYVPGVGIDLNKFAPEIIDDVRKLEKRTELGIKDTDTVFVSVGEINKDKSNEKD